MAYAAILLRSSAQGRREFESRTLRHGEVGESGLCQQSRKLPHLRVS